MDPYSYKIYAEVFDFFSNENVFPKNIEFINRINKIIHPKDKVSDIGGGTGRFTEKLLIENPDIELTFVEPSKDMMDIAKKRLPKSCNFFEKKADEVIDSIGKQNIFIFQKSLYAFYNNLDEYIQLFKITFNLLEEDGYLCIQQIPPYFHINEFKEYCLNQFVKIGIDEKEFQEKWKIYEKGLVECNEKITNGTFLNIDGDTMIKILLSVGFRLEFYEWPILFFKKVSIENF